VAGETVDRDEFLDLLKASISQATTARVSLETSSAAGGLKGAGDIDFATTPPSISLQLNVPQLGGDAELRLVDGVAFVKLPQLGGKYVSFDLSDPANPLGSAFADQLDIESQFDAFGDAIQEVTYVGTEDIDKEQLERYTLTVDGQAVAEQAGGAGLGAGADLLPDVITYDIWFDAEGLFRQLTFDLDEQGVSSTITYSDWGKDVSITAPKPSEVTSLPRSPGAG